MTNINGKTTYSFVFSEELQAHHFIQAIQRQYEKAEVRHPYAGRPDQLNKCKVLLTDTGSELYDAALLHFADEQAFHFGGYRMPH